MSHRKAFTLIEMLVVIAIIAVLIAVLLPALSTARAMSRRSACAGNLSGIGKAMAFYASAEGTFPTNMPPKTTARLGKWINPPTPGTAPITEDPNRALFTVQYGAPGEPMVNLWLLVVSNALQPKQFLCRDDPRNPHAAWTAIRQDAGTVENILNFGASNALLEAGDTFSYAFPYPWISNNSTVPLWWKGGADARQPIGADIGPSMTPPDNDPTAIDARGNSKNHGGKGQNVLFADAHVDFSKTSRVGKVNDNIYTGNKDAIFVQGGGQRFNIVTSLNTDPNDVVLVPAAP